MEIKVDNASVETLVTNEIRLAVAKAIEGKNSYLVQRLVTEVLERKKDHYSRETIIEGTIDAMIQSAAKEAAQEWVNQMKPEIKKLVAAKLGSKTKGLIAQVADQLVANFGKGIDVSVYFNKPG